MRRLVLRLFVFWAVLFGLYYALFSLVHTPESVGPDGATPDTAAQIPAAAPPQESIDLPALQPGGMPVIYREIIDGELIYEGTEPPPQVFKGTPRIENSGRHNPTLAELERTTAAYLEKMPFYEIDRTELITAREMNELSRYSEIRFVDDRFLVGVGFSAPSERANELADLYAKLAGLTNWTTKRHSLEALETAFDTAVMSDIQGQIDALREELREQGIKTRMRTAAVSIETLQILLGG